MCKYFLQLTSDRSEILVKAVFKNSHSEFHSGGQQIPENSGSLKSLKNIIRYERTVCDEWIRNFFADLEFPHHLYHLNNIRTMANTLAMLVAHK